jgi:hypothetical protein
MLNLKMNLNNYNIEVMIREDDWLGEEVNKQVDGRRGASVQDLRNEIPAELVTQKRTTTLFRYGRRWCVWFSNAVL